MIGCLWESVQECLQELWIFSANGYLMTAIHFAGQAMNVKAVIYSLVILAQLERFKKLTTHQLSHNCFFNAEAVGDPP